MGTDLKGNNPIDDVRNIGMYLVLKYIENAGKEGVRFNELLRSFWRDWNELSPATLSSYLKKLVEMGYVRVEAKSEGRMTIPSYKITEEGVKKLKEFLKDLTALIEFLKRE